MIQVVRTPAKMSAVFNKLDKEHSHGLSQKEFNMFILASAKRKQYHPTEKLLSQAWDSTTRHKLEDHDEISERAMRSWLFGEGGESKEGQVDAIKKTLDLLGSIANNNFSVPVIIDVGIVYPYVCTMMSSMYA